MVDADGAVTITAERGEGRSGVSRLWIADGVPSVLSVFWTPYGTSWNILLDRGRSWCDLMQLDAYDTT